MLPLLNIPIPALLYVYTINMRSNYTCVPDDETNFVFRWFRTRHTHVQSFSKLGHDILFEVRV